VLFRSLAAALAQVRADAEAILAVGRVVGPEYLAGTAPFQDQLHARALVFDFLWSHALMLRGWAARADAAIAGWEGAAPPARAEVARETIRDLLAVDAPGP